MAPCYVGTDASSPVSQPIIYASRLQLMRQTLGGCHEILAMRWLDGASICLADTVRAEGYRNHLEWIARQHFDSTGTVTWPQDQKRCQQGYKMLVRHQHGSESYGTASRFLSRIQQVRRIGYILLGPNDPKHGEWIQSCWYAETWKREGIWLSG